MTTVYCSNKLKDFLGPKFFSTPVDLTSNLFGDWNADLFNVGRQRYLILVNNKSYYSVILQDIRKAHFKDFSTLFFNRLTQQLLFDKVIEPADILLVIQKFTPLTFARTNNDKKNLGTINDFINNFHGMTESPYWHGRNILEFNSGINDTPTGAGRTGRRQYGRPIEDMRTLLSTSH